MFFPASGTVADIAEEQGVLSPYPVTYEDDNGPTGGGQVPNQSKKGPMLNYSGPSDDDSKYEKTTLEQVRRRNKRNPGCMRQCLLLRLLHPSQCHFIC
jgi:hypothetical protein